MKKLREASGLTQLEVAKRAQIDRTRVCLWEGGYVELSEEEEERVRVVLLIAAQKRAEVIQGAVQDIESVRAGA